MLRQKEAIGNLGYKLVQLLNSVRRFTQGIPKAVIQTLSYYEHLLLDMKMLKITSRLEINIKSTVIDVLALQLYLSLDKETSTFGP
jgi:hypothetical protein